MHTITLQINDESALKTLKNLESKHFISVIEDSDLDSPALPGSAMSLKQFKSWIENAEQGPTVSLNEAREKWASRKKQLQKLTK